MPGKPITFNESKVIHTFEDGWTIHDLSSAVDLDAFGAAMGNCWTATGYGNWAAKILPAPGIEDKAALEAVARERAVKRWDRPEYRKSYGDEWVESRIENDVQTIYNELDRAYKLMALVDEDGNLRAGWSLGLRDKPTVTYGSCDALAQKRQSWIELDGFEFCFLELHSCREVGAPYSYTPDAGTRERIADWWQGACAGEWQAAAFETRYARV